MRDAQAQHVHPHIVYRMTGGVELLVRAELFGAYTWQFITSEASF